MSFDEEYYTYLEIFYNDMLISKDKKYSKCEGCENKRKFLKVNHQVEKTSKKPK